MSPRHRPATNVAVSHASDASSGPATRRTKAGLSTKCPRNSGDGRVNDWPDKPAERSENKGGAKKNVWSKNNMARTLGIQSVKSRDWD